MENHIELLKILIPIISGGVAGALLNNYFNKKKEKKQNIQYSLELYPLKIGIEKLGDRATLISNISEDERCGILHNLVLRVKNTGNKDEATFKFSIKGPNSVSFFSMVNFHEEILHEAKVIHPEKLSIEFTSNVLSIELNPFNRDDFYFLSIFFHSYERDLYINKFEIDSKQPVNFIHEDTYVTYAYTMAENKLELYISILKSLWRELPKTLFKTFQLILIVFVILYFFKPELLNFIKQSAFPKEEPQIKIYKPDNYDRDGIEE